MIPFIHVLEQATLIYRDKKLEWWLPLTLGEMEKGQEEILWVIKAYLVSGMGFTGVHICQNSSDRIHITHASC